MRIRKNGPSPPKGFSAFCEKWDPAARDGSLEQAFLVTPEFHALQVLFQKTEAPQEPALLLNLACEGNWDLLERYSREQSQMLDLTVDKRRRLLLSYLALQSPSAAQLLLRTDFVFALKKLEDKGILDLIGLLKNKTEESERFCVELLRSPRSDAIWQAAAIRLYAYVGESLSAPLDPKEALARFASNVPVECPGIRSLCIGCASCIRRSGCDRPSGSRRQSSHPIPRGERRGESLEDRSHLQSQAGRFGQFQPVGERPALSRHDAANSLSRNRIGAAPVKRVAFEKPAKDEPRGAEGAVFFHRLASVVRAGGKEAAAMPGKRA